MEQLLTIQLLSAFVVGDQRPLSGVTDVQAKAEQLGLRWGKDVTWENVIVGAEARIDEHHRVSKKPSNRDTGITKISIGGIKDRLLLRLTPPSMSACDEAAGPLLGPPVLPKDTPPAGEKELYKMMPLKRYRPLEVEVFLSDSHIVSVPAPRVVAGMTHGRVIGYNVEKNLLVIDWKPEWVTGRGREDRAKRNVTSVDPRHGNVTEAAPLHFAKGNGVIVLHRTTTSDIGSTLSDFIMSSEKGAHYIIDLDGHVLKMADDKNEMTYHAGRRTQWEGLSSVNFFSIGIEIVNETGRTFTPAQMSSVVRLVDKLRKHFKISRDRVLAHCEVKDLITAKGLLINEKIDCPGFEFDWTILEKNGHATYPSFRENAKLPPGLDEFFLNNIDDTLMHQNTDKGRGRYGKKSRALPSRRNDLVSQLQRNLYELGYEFTSLEHRGDFDEMTEQLVRRFQGRYMTGPRARYLSDGGDDKKLLGRVSIHTIAMMQAVLAAKGKEWRTFW